MWPFVLTFFVLLALPPLVVLYLVERFRLARALGRQGSKLLAATPYLYPPFTRRLHAWRLMAGTVCFDVRYRGADGVERVDRFWPVGTGGTASGLRRVERGPLYLTPELPSSR